MTECKDGRVATEFNDVRVTIEPKDGTAVLVRPDAPTVTIKLEGMAGTGVPAVLVSPSGNVLFVFADRMVTVKPDGTQVTEPRYSGGGSE